MDMYTETSPDLAQLLPREAFLDILWMLRGALPPPVSDKPAVKARRDRVAMAAVAGLLPVTVPEGRLAAQFVLADSWARDCLRLAGERRREPDIARKCQAQAVSLMREGKSALRELRQLQNARLKRETDDAAVNRAAWVEHSALGMMRDALGAAEDELGEVEAGIAGAVSNDETNSSKPISETETRRSGMEGASGSEAGGGMAGRHKSGRDEEAFERMEASAGADGRRR